MRLRTWKREEGTGHWSSQGIRMGMKKVASSKVPIISGMAKSRKNPTNADLTTWYVMVTSEPTEHQVVNSVSRTVLAQSFSFL